MAVNDLLRGAIIAVEGMKKGSISVKNITSATAIRAVGVLDHTEWQCWASVYGASFNLVTKPMFEAVMENEGFNMPALVRGMWKDWAEIAEGMLQSDGALDVKKIPKLEGLLAKLSSEDKTEVLTRGLLALL